MQYILNIFTDEKRYESMPPAQREAAAASYIAYTKALKDAGVWVAGERLRPVSDSTQVRVSPDGKTSVIDGPYADTKEQLGGFYIINVPDLDEAISWAARCPGATFGTMEVRPIWELPVTAA
jgi:hypothetical protein